MATVAIVNIAALITLLEYTPKLPRMAFMIQNRNFDQKESVFVFLSSDMSRRGYRVRRNIFSFLRSSWISLESCRFDASHRRQCVIFAGVAGNANRTDHVAIATADQYAARAWHDAAAARRRDGR